MAATVTELSADRPRLAHFALHSRLMVLEVRLETVGQLLRRLIEARRVRPGVARDEDFLRRAGTLRHHVKAKNGITQGRRRAKRSGVDGVDDRTRNGQRHPLADAVWPAAPAGVD